MSISWHPDWRRSIDFAFFCPVSKPPGEEVSRGLAILIMRKTACHSLGKDAKRQTGSDFKFLPRDPAEVFPGQ
jgi:hypothetical protein